MFIEVHHKKSGEALLLNADAIESVGDHTIYVREDNQPYQVRETLAELSLLLDPKRLDKKPAQPVLPRVQLAKHRAS